MKKGSARRNGSPTKPVFICVGGASGSGKSSLRALRPELFQFFPFYDVDQIAADLEKEHNLPKGKGWKMARRHVDQAVRGHMERMESFGTETTFILQERIDLLINSKKQGYCTRLLFLGTRNAQTNVSRVRGRVKNRGRHDVPEETIRNDWREAPKNLEKNLFNIDIVEIYDAEPESSGGPIPIAIKEEDHQFRLCMPAEKIPEWARRIIGKSPRN